MVWYCVWNASTKSIIWKLFFISCLFFSISQWGCGTGCGTLLWSRLSGKPQMMIMLTWALNAFKKLIICKKITTTPRGLFHCWWCGYEMSTWNKAIKPFLACWHCKCDDDIDFDDTDDKKDDGDIYIMMHVCLFVTKNEHFLLGVSCNHLNPP